ncbi:CPBP family intramembrane metalloprotease [Flavimobilis sp. GY10621]|uniref:CPBP family intramembrane metalloprotease n=1 Tax=Flavimobilis rhizosphaerae TaxID=2775421 RepID=A0ABR9DNM7_9MICO|nr:CPBP family intramembrane glutamic endopeptidase [Flavimobilis rhizosphaerae]MBD9698534.1 CPBP family intramembrane metalloprotease [Flavimobilis rhizosphaerae]
MTTASPATTLRVRGPRTARLVRLTQHPAVWLPVGVVGVGAVASLTAQREPLTVVPVLGAVLAIVVYVLVMRRMARRATPELAAGRTVPEALGGAALGLGLVAAAAGIVTALGGYTFAVADVDVLAVVVPVLTVTLGVAVTEELIFRGLGLQALERLRGSGLALGVTAVLFGAVHLLNPGATLWSGLAITVEAGVLLGAAFLWRRNLWFVMGLHLAWNSAVALLGVPVSGHESTGLLVAEASGPAFLTGGAFGIEGSAVTVVLGLALAVPMLVAAHRGGTLVPARGPRP